MQYSVGVQLKREAVASDGTFEGYASTFNGLDSVGDSVCPGAFSATLKAWASRGKLPPLMLAHGGFLGGADDAIPIGRFTDMHEDGVGLAVKAQLLALHSDRGMRLYEAVKSGTLDGLSIGYVATGVRYGRGPGEPERVLTEIDLKEVSLCPWPADANARVTAVKANSQRAFEAQIHSLGFSRKQARAICAVAWPVIAKFPHTESPDLGPAAALVRQLTAALRGD